jgi:hypothetical protein
MLLCLPHTSSPPLGALFKSPIDSHCQHQTAILLSPSQPPCHTHPHTQTHLHTPPMLILHYSAHIHLSWRPIQIPHTLTLPAHWLTSLTHRPHLTSTTTAYTHSFTYCIPNSNFLYSCFPCPPKAPRSWPDRLRRPTL